MRSPPAVMPGPATAPTTSILGVAPAAGHVVQRERDRRAARAPRAPRAPRRRPQASPTLGLPMTAIRAGVAPPGGCRVLVASMATMARETPSAAATQTVSPNRLPAGDPGEGADDVTADEVPRLRERAADRRVDQDRRGPEGADEERGVPRLEDRGRQQRDRPLCAHRGRPARTRRSPAAPPPGGGAPSPAHLGEVPQLRRRGCGRPVAPGSLPSPGRRSLHPGPGMPRAHAGRSPGCPPRDVDEGLQLAHREREVLVVEDGCTRIRSTAAARHDSRSPSAILAPHSACRRRRSSSYCAGPQRRRPAQPGRRIRRGDSREGSTDRMASLVARSRTNLTAKIVLLVCASEVLLLIVLGVF